MLVEKPEPNKVAPHRWLKEFKLVPLTQKETKTLSNNHVWVTARGEEIFVHKMATNHINNCIRCFNGQGHMRIPNDYLGGKDKWMKIFSQELLQRQ